MFSRILFLTLTTCMSVSVFAQAQSAADAAASIAAEDQMNQAVALEQGEAQVLAPGQTTDAFPGRIVGEVIGGAIDGIIGAGDPLFRRPGMVACFAHNLRGQRFKAIGYFPRRVQDRAVAQCYNYGSVRCFAEGCNY